MAMSPARPKKTTDRLPLATCKHRFVSAVSAASSTSTRQRDADRDREWYKTYVNFTDVIRLAAGISMVTVVTSCACSTLFFVSNFNLNKLELVVLFICLLVCLSVSFYQCSKWNLFDLEFSVRFFSSLDKVRCLHTAAIK